MRRRNIVIGAWLIVIVLGLLASTGVSSLLSTSLSVPGTDSARADAILQKHFGENVEGTFTVVLPFGNASQRQIAGFEARIARAAASVPTGKVTQQKALFGVLYANVATSLDLGHAAPYTPTLRDALKANGLAKAMVTGPPALQYDLTPVLTSDLHRGEALAIVLALALLIAVLGLCWAVAVPFVVAGATISAAIAIVYVLAHHFLMVLYIPNVVELIGLGLAIDYSLLIVHRFRHEIRDEDVDVERAIVATMTTAGRTVVLSGATVAIGLATLFLIPVPFVRSLGAAGLIVPVVALLAALTLQPALLSLLGRRGVRPVAITGLMAGRDVLGGRCAAVARRVVAHPRRTLAVSLVILALMGVSAFWLQLTPGSTSAIPQDLESAKALTLVSSRVGPAVVTPNQIVIDLGAPGRALSASARASTLALATKMLQIPEVFAVAIDTKAPFVDPTGRYEQILVIGRNEFGAEESQQLVRILRTQYVPQARFSDPTTIYVGGAAAQGVDFLDTVYGSFIWIILVALALAFVVLARAFRSLALAAVAVVLDLVSVGVAYGLLVLCFRFGVGSAVLGTYQVSQIEGWVPVFLFAMLFGLSMDYEVFIVARMRESYDAGASTNDSIVDGIARTGGVVSAAAVILVGALSGLIFGHIAGLQELGVGLALGILVDATIVRGLVLPSVMTLLGRWNWWLPQWSARLLRTKASPLEERGARP